MFTLRSKKKSEQCENKMQRNVYIKVFKLTVILAVTTRRPMCHAPAIWYLQRSSHNRSNVIYQPRHTYEPVTTCPMFLFNYVLRTTSHSQPVQRHFSALPHLNDLITCSMSPSNHALLKTTQSLRQTSLFNLALSYIQ